MPHSSARSTPRVLGVIPARIGSSRLPRKPLQSIAGRPLIEWVWRRALAADLFAVVVIATDSEEIEEVASGFGARVELTSSEHPSGTDRVAEIAERDAYRGFEVIANIQGDEPFVRREQLEHAVQLVDSGGWDVGTVAVPVASVAEWRDPSVVKVVRDARGGAMLFSRAPIPFRRDRDPDEQELASGYFLRHLGIYTYRREALLRWVQLPESDLERFERLEQLRPLAAGIGIGVAVVAAPPAGEGGVDTPEDAARAERRLLELFPSRERAFA
ncbi:MAG: 3-deoxy-manno-octulosonate cytidylyltransferase [Gemmatimonadetes bacterium]|nr:3-deoxy-manno-octulosonate cytidylyltransferase [Gemmatimonadota bacterium]